MRKSVDEWLEFRGEERQRRIRAIMEVRVPRTESPTRVLRSAHDASDPGRS